MAAELDFSPPEIPEPTFMENILHYGLFFGAIFQLICVLAIILPIPKTHKMNIWLFHIWSKVIFDIWSKAIGKPSSDI
uniref:Mannosidase beta like n=1 Tax=Podarcis muralis TaxID=64176 RepID=A0A670K8X2_PODMU